MIEVLPRVPRQRLMLLRRKRAAWRTENETRFLRIALRDNVERERGKVDELRKELGKVQAYQAMANRVAPDKDLDQCLRGFAAAMLPLVQHTQYASGVDVKAWIEKVRLTAMTAPAPAWKPVIEHLVELNKQAEAGKREAIAREARNTDAAYLLRCEQAKNAQLTIERDRWQTRHAFVTVQLTAAIDSNKRVGALYAEDQKAITGLRAQLHTTTATLNTLQRDRFDTERGPLPTTLEHAHLIIQGMRLSLARERIPNIDYHAAILTLEGKVERAERACAGWQESCDYVQKARDDYRKKFYEAEQRIGRLESYKSHALRVGYVLDNMRRELQYVKIPISVWRATARRLHGKYDAKLLRERAKGQPSC